MSKYKAFETRSIIVAIAVLVVVKGTVLLILWPESNRLRTESERIQNEQRASQERTHKRLEEMRADKESREVLKARSSIQPRAGID
jgi:hypothetical protein